ncbi:MAG: DUF4203 domain-containing protein [Gammaproteobacteria bacterium]|nr:DUF4203 domain-containing protein [Gammaproteobacteria bacterium]
MPPIVAIAAGAVLLVAGRKLFWLFIAITGFFVGVEVARDLLVDQPEWAIWVFAAGAGIIGALLAMLFERVAFALAGFYAGGYVAMVAAQALGLDLPGLAVFVSGGVLGAVIATFVMDWAIIILSSLVGAGLIVGALDIESMQRAILAGVLVAGGVLVQAGMMRGKLGNPMRRGG